MIEIFIMANDTRRGPQVVLLFARLLTNFHERGTSSRKCSPLQGDGYSTFQSAGDGPPQVVLKVVMHMHRFFSVLIVPIDTYVVEIYTPSWIWIPDSSPKRSGQVLVAHQRSQRKIQIAVVDTLLTHVI
jgi:hypothetical protein